MPETTRAVLTKMARPALLRSDRDLKARFSTSREEVRRRTVRSGAWAGLALYVLFAFLDLVVVPDVAYVTIPARLIGSVPTVVSVEFGFRTDWSADALDRIAAFCLFALFQVWIRSSGQTADGEMLAY